MAALLRFRPILFALVVAVAGLLPAAAQEPTLVRVDTVRRVPLDQTFTVIGRVVARQQGPVAARVAGPVAEVRIEVGDRVREGNVLAVIDRDRYVLRRDLARAQLAEQKAALATAEARAVMAQAAIGAAEARLAQARQELARLEGLRRSAAFSPARYDDQRQAVAVAASDLDEAHAAAQEALSLIEERQAAVARYTAALELAEDELADTAVRAPYAGVVTLRRAERGAWLEVGDQVATLVNDADVELEADVPFERLGGLAPGVAVRFHLDEGRDYEATVRAVGVVENPNTRTRPVRFTPRFGDARPRLAAGQSAAIAIPAGPPREVLSVHKDAIIRDDGGTIVFVVVAGQAEARPVTLGEAVGPRIEVVAGLAEGDLAVVRGNERLIPGQPVRFDGGS